jgi:hypothetical protein
VDPFGWGEGHREPGKTPEGIIAIADAIPDMRALLLLNLSRNNLWVEGTKLLAEALKGNQMMTELDLSSNAATYDGNKNGEMSGIIALADTIKDMGALSATNVMGNRIGKEQLAKLQEIMRSKPNLVSLCGIGDHATEADLCGLGMDADDAAILASELPDKEALAKLDISSNNIAAAQGGDLQRICTASGIELAK